MVRLIVFTLIRIVTVAVTVLVAVVILFMVLILIVTQGFLVLQVTRMFALIT